MILGGRATNDAVLLFLPCGKHNNVRFYKTPKIIRNQGEETQTLSEERRLTWKMATNRTDITSEERWDRTIVCSSHFVNGEKAYLYDITSPSWLPTLKLDDSAASQSASTIDEHSIPTNFAQMSKQARAAKTLLLLQKLRSTPINFAQMRKEAVAVESLLLLQKLQMSSPEENHIDDPVDLPDGAGMNSYSDGWIMEDEYELSPISSTNSLNAIQGVKEVQTDLTSN
uniref:THAP-type domain-containing protein n=1 Tax=Eptatretus burgeri TaxID=7764 RepID=A0A8C4Q4D4_EPTBU